MGRSQNQKRNKEQGFPVKNYKSKTSPSAVKAQLQRNEANDLGRIYPRRHTGKTELKASLAKKFGVPANSKFIFRTSSKERPEGEYLKNLKNNYGSVVVVNKRDASLVLAVRCNKFKKMSNEQKEHFRVGISTPYLRARARNGCTLHSSIQVFILACLLWGWMGCCGWRGGSDSGKSLGPYALNDFTSKDKNKVEDDRARMTRFHKIRDFWAEQFSTLCLSVFQSNIKLAKDANIPGFDQLEWQHTPNGRVFASNLVVTCDGFRNNNHTDDYDHTRYSYGMFSLIDRTTGEPYELEGSFPRGNVLGASFIVKEFGIEVDFSGCDGVVEMVWDTRVKHQSTTSTAVNAKGKKIRHKDGELTRFGSSCQISDTVVGRIRMIEGKKENMSEEEWLDFVQARVKSYEDQIKDKVTQSVKGNASSVSKAKSLYEEKFKVQNILKKKSS